mmetsp:Transcript_44704/g.69981  ORF Transcript_44704/g.69981 Transcript_44704/m.69981 type:complete len:109 (-) Transcript_44704:76-402(-)
MIPLASAPITSHLNIRNLQNLLWFLEIWWSELGLLLGGFYFFGVPILILASRHSDLVLDAALHSIISCQPPAGKALRCFLRVSLQYPTLTCPKPPSPRSCRFSSPLSE